MTLGALLDSGCVDYANHARIMLLVLDAQDRSPLAASETAALMQQMVAICPERVEESPTFP